ncbi:hypothetical protein ACHAQF_008016 [Verticillium nonalfalfae]
MSFWLISSGLSVIKIRDLASVDDLDIFLYFYKLVGLRHLTSQRLGDNEVLSVGIVENIGTLAGKLKMLPLVVSHRDMGGSVYQHVGCLQDRIGKEAQF